MSDRISDRMMMVPIWPEKATLGDGESCTLERSDPEVWLEVTEPTMRLRFHFNRKELVELIDVATHCLAEMDSGSVEAARALRSEREQARALKLATEALKHVEGHGGDAGEIACEALEAIQKELA